MELEPLLAWFVGASSLLGFVSILRRYGRSYPGWLFAHGLVLVVLGLAWLVVPAHAGLLGAIVFVPMVLLPSLANRAAARFIARRRFDRARVAAQVAAVLHPFDGWTAVPELLRAQGLIERGHRDEARAALEALARGSGRAAREAWLLLLRMDTRWHDLIAWVDASPERQKLLMQPEVASNYVRALGELGQTARLAEVHQGVIERLGRAQGPGWLANNRLVYAAFTGQPDAIAALQAGPFLQLTPSLVAFWTGTALQARGDLQAAEAVLVPLALGQDPLVAGPARRRLAEPVPTFDLAAHGQPRLLDTVLAAEGPPDAQTTLAAPGRGPFPAVTATLIALNLAVFALEIPGGTTDVRNLLRMGALVAPAAYLEGEWWRVVTSAFLHVGVLHLTLNMFGLWIFGRFVESVLGRARMALLYAICAPGSMALITLLTPANESPYPVAGASGGIMALFGAIASIMFIRWRAHRSLGARRELLYLGLLFVASTAFDLSTPEVSFLGHASGAALGLVMGALLAPRRRRT
ncbi:MAG: rhomboid family intramembrane serine protease [Deltaproteobacteria bacterium]|nr:rhomboid family intramembrane serine protease [Deltaproteobacteria bacterium]